MSDGSAIEWCDATWTIAVGCTRVSAGCDHCYAMHFTHRGLHETHRGLTKLRPKDASRPGVDWNGTVRTLPERLADPLKWRNPRRVFVGSMTDLFHPAIPFEYVAAVFGVMAACPQHTFLVLTKRPERAREFFGAMFGLEDTETTVAVEAERHGVIWDARGSERWRYRSEPTRLELRRPWVWPLPNVHLGTSVEDQATADARIPDLLQCPAALHWVSAEPLLGPVRMDYALWATHLHGTPSIRWIVIGGESGHGARRFDIEWARDLVGFAAGSSCAVFVKQLGSKPVALDYPGGYLPMHLDDSKGGDMSEWPADLRVREVP